MKKSKKISKKNEKKRWFYATITLAILGISLLSYGIYASTPSMNTSTLPTGVGNQLPSEDVFTHVSNIKKLETSIFNILDLDPNAIDQIQDEQQGDLNWLIGFNPTTDNDNIIQQLVSNDREPFNGFQVKIAMRGSPNEPVYFGIMDSHAEDPTNPDNWDLIGYLDTLPQEQTWYWVGIEHQLPQIIADDPYGIVALSACVSYPNDYWMWARNDNNPYDNGYTRYWDDGIWHTLQTGNTDFCFVTYTVPNGGGEEPVISIAITSSIASTFFGILSLLGAAFSGYKYFIVLA